MFVLSLILTTTTLVAFGFAFDQTDQRIIGGTLAKPGQFPFLAGMMVNDTVKPYIWCSAAIIAKQWATIQANCVADFANGHYYLDFRLLVGTNSLVSGGTNYTVVSMILHPDYEYNDVTYNIKNDIALLKIDGEFVLSETVATVEVGQAQPNEYCTIMGWGGQSNSVHIYPDDLYFAHTLILSNDDCERLSQGADSLPMVDPGEVCSFSAGGVSPWDGDKGPLVCDNKLVGLISYTIGIGYPFINTQIAFYKEWIDNIISA